MPERESTESLIISIIAGLYSEYGDDLVGVDIDYQASGHYPFRIRLRSDPLPDIGQAVTAHPPADGGETSAAEQSAREEGSDA